MLPEKITSLQNPKIKNLKKLEKSSERKAQGLIIIEGLREIVLASRAGYEIDSLFVCEEIVQDKKEYPLAEIRHKTQDTRQFEVTPVVYESLAYREGTEGIIAVAKPKSHALDDLHLSKTPLLLVIEGVEKPGNLGAMLRTADAAGVDAVIICDPKTDFYNPNVIRSSIGTVFTNQLASASTKDVIAYLRNKGISIFAAELNGAVPHYVAELNKPSAIVVGTEATGLSEEWIKAADANLKIPMLGKIDSLNVSVSAAVLLYEAVRQRTPLNPLKGT